MHIKNRGKNILTPSFIKKLVIAVIIVGVSIPILSVRPEVANEPPIAIFPDDFKNIKLSAKAAYVLDVNQNKTLFSLNEDAQLPLASLTKIMTAVTALSLIPDYTSVTIVRDFLSPEGDSELLVDEKWKLKDLVNLTLVNSSNDGARAIASAAGAFKKNLNDYNMGRREFIYEMNKKTKELRLSQTYFLNETGLDESAAISGGYGSAKDMTMLMKYALQNFPSVFEGTRKENLIINSLNEIKHDLQNTNKEVNNIPLLLGSKTGYTDLAGGNLVIGFDAGFNRPIIITVLGSTEEGRFEDVEALVWASLEHIKRQ